MSKKRIRAVRFGSHTLGWRWELPADADSYERMVNQIAQSMSPGSWDMHGESHDYLRQDARDALRAIGITPPKKG